MSEKNAVIRQLAKTLVEDFDHTPCNTVIRHLAKILVEDFDHMPCNYEEHPECTGEGELDCIKCLIDSTVKEVKSNQ